ncbi:hypothetical protein [Mucilaginibacter jinjuensis]|uniref:Uncharacterized protein n=1 Tax=Mucilaginibacter jinjuensis TaxID=1176721 RepID=A0ABY7TDP5_9SPHI|nr:hypothetical protein [Mucilaginibacter jinjuensis]WCT14456.1 hypothetical protein PQO05_10980 [Mucilaginibacter jinjuensis]
MRNKLQAGRALVMALLFILMIWDILMLAWGREKHLPEPHKKMLLAGTLVWISTLFLNQNRDDDWAGQL